MSVAILVAGLGYGDEGKGQLVHKLTKEFDAHLVVRFNGGPQAAHNVVTEDGRHHTFSQFGSASFHPRANTHLSQFMTVNPLSLMNEARHLSLVSKRSVDQLLGSLTIDERALIVTPYQKEANRFREIARRATGKGHHGSCGVGIGECQSDFLIYGEKVLFVKDLRDRDRLRDKLRFMRDVQIEKRATEPLTSLVDDSEFFSNLVELYWRIGQRLRIVTSDYLRNSLQLKQSVIFEGAQGVLLDQKYGFAPYHSWSDCTFGNVYKILAEADFQGTVNRFGVLRAYATRHGAGPFVTEDALLTESLHDPYNPENPWQGPFRVGHFDLPVTHYALSVIGGVDKIFLTCNDALHDLPESKVCLSYEPPVGKNHYFDDKGLIGFDNVTSLTYQQELAQVLFQTRVKEFKTFCARMGRIDSYVKFLTGQLRVKIEPFDLE